VISEAEMIEALRQELAQAIQAVETLAEVLREAYFDVEGLSIADNIEDAFEDLKLDL